MDQAQFQQTKEAETDRDTKQLSEDWRQKLKHLQSLLKHENSLLWTQSEQKNSFEKKLSEIILLYYRNKIHSSTSSSRKLFRSTRSAFKSQADNKNSEHLNPFNNKDLLSKVKNYKETIKESWENVKDLSAFEPGSNSEQSKSSLSSNRKSDPTSKEKKILSNDRILLEDEGFGDSCFYIKEVLISLSKDPQLMLTIIRKHQLWSNTESLESIVHPIVDSLYENILDDQIQHKKYFLILDECFRLIVNSSKHYYEVKLQKDTSFAGLIVKEFLRRMEIKSYAKQVVRNTVLEIGKVDHELKWLDSVSSAQNPLKKRESDVSKSGASSSMGRKSNLTEQLEYSERGSQQKPGPKVSFAEQFEADSLRMSKPQNLNRYQRPVRDSKINPQTKVADGSSKIQQYVEALKVKDEKLLSESEFDSVSRKSPLPIKSQKCISNELLTYLGISEEIQFPTFVSSTASTEVKKEEQIHKQMTAMLTHRTSLSHKNPDIITVKNIVLIFFSDLFKMLYALPLSLRLACKRLYAVLEARFSSKKAAFYVLSEYVLELGILQHMEFDENLPEQFDMVNFEKRQSANEKRGSSQGFQSSDWASKNLETVRGIVVSVLRNDYKNIPRSFEHEFSLIASNLRNSLFNYLGEIINVQCTTAKGDSPKREGRGIQSHAVCISLSEIKRLFEMIRLCKAELKQENHNEKLNKRIERVEMVSDGKDLFAERSDSRTGAVYRPENAYVMFYELELPEDLQVDYLKYHEGFFKKEKMNKLIKLLLLGIKDVDQYLEFHEEGEMFDFLRKLALRESSIDRSSRLEAVDHIGSEVKAKYLVSLVKNHHMESEYSEVLCRSVQKMQREAEARMQYYESVWDQSKESYLKAISSVIFLNQALEHHDGVAHRQLKARKLEEFMCKTKISVCLTSPKTREKEIVLKTNIMKDLSEEERARIWLENQSKCVHTALNLEFIKSLTGEPEKIRRHESHCSSITRFPDLFCSLPEIRSSTSTGALGIKDAFYDFIKYCVNIAAQKEGCQVLVEDRPWLEDNLEQKLSKRIYEKLYPKNPTYEDIAFYLRLKTLSFVSYHHLRIEPSLRFEKMWEMAGKQLRRIDKVKTVGEKLSCINECTKIITSSCHLISEKQVISADDIFPIVVYVLIKAAPKRIISNMKFVEYFGNQSKLLSKEGYSFSQLKAAIEYCDRLDYLSIDMLEREHTSEENCPDGQTDRTQKSPSDDLEKDRHSLLTETADKHIQFQKTIYEKEIQFGIYFLLLQKKETVESKNSKIDFLKKFFREVTDQVPLQG